MAKNYGTLTEPESFDKLITKIEDAQKPFGFDIETGYDGQDKEKCSLNCEDPLNKLAGASFSGGLEWGRYVPVGHDLGPNMPEREFAELWWRLLQTGLGVPHNAKFELRHLATFFRRVLHDVPEVMAADGYFPVRSDTMIELYIEAELQSVGLKAATKAKFAHEMAELGSLFPGVAKNKHKSLRFNVLELRPDVVAYACEDSLWTLAHHLKTYPKVKDDFLYKVEMQLLPILCAMEDYGVKYDWSAMASASIEAKQFLIDLDAEIQAQLTAMLGTPVAINLGSPKQISDVLYDKLGMTTSVKTDTGAMSTGAIALTTLSKQYPVVRRILDWKEMRKLIDTYLAKYEGKFAFARDGMTHPNIIQTGTITGRFAVADPPYQQTPKKYDYTLDSGSHFELDFRNFIVAPPEHYILGYDYSQIELRVMAGESQEPSLLQAFRKKQDVHTATAALMLGLSVDAVGSDERAIGKTMNFALLYGMGAKSLGERLGIERAEAASLYDQYFAAYSAIRVWVERQQNEGRQKGYTTSRFGRRHTIWELRSTDAWIYSKGERLCVNAPIQGGAADYMKVSMVRANGALEKAGLLDRVHLVMNIHDALEFYVHDSVPMQEVIDVLLPAVTYPVDGYPPIVADWHVGAKWGSLSEIKLDDDGQIIDTNQPKASPEKSATEVDYLEPSETMQAAVKTVMKDLVPAKADETFETARHVMRTAWNTSMPYEFEDGQERYDASLPHPKHSRSREDETCIHCGKQRSPLHAQAQKMMEKAAEPPKTIHVRVTEMPDHSQLQSFVKLLEQRSGRNSVVLETPEGTVAMARGTDLDLGDQGEVSMCLGGAEVFYPAEAVSADDIVAGMTL